MIFGIRKYMQSYRENVDDMIPAKVISYDSNTNRATVQPLISIQDQQHKHPQQHYPIFVYDRAVMDFYPSIEGR